MELSFLFESLKYLLLGYFLAYSIKVLLGIIIYFYRKRNISEIDRWRNTQDRKV